VSGKSRPTVPIRSEVTDMPIRFRALAGPIFVIALVAGCSSSSGGSVAPASQAPVSQAPASAAAPSAAPVASAAASGGATSGVTVEAKPVGTIGTVLVAGSNGMTVYTFTQDVKDSGKSNCTGSCITTWPAVTVAGGATPTAGSGVSGKLGTITRDDGKTQVTYNGLPLYFFANDHAPGDANGVYTGWEAVKP
jgi:predicted lipoprotein with Yx(FWY)xxD motif